MLSSIIIGFHSRPLTQPIVVPYYYRAFKSYVIDLYLQRVAQDLNKIARSCYVFILFRMTISAPTNPACSMDLTKALKASKLSKNYLLPIRMIIRLIDDYLSTWVTFRSSLKTTSTSLICAFSNRKTNFRVNLKTRKYFIIVWLQTSHKNLVWFTSCGIHMNSRRGRSNIYKILITR